MKVAKTVLLGISTATLVLVGVIWLMGRDVGTYYPSDLSDLYDSPSSPVVVTDVAALQERIIVASDLAVITRDGTRLSANVYRPEAPGRYPVVMMITAYHKDEGPRRYPDMLRKHLTDDYDQGTIRVSPWTPWEGPDPAYWVGQGYAVVTLDSRGYGKSEGVAGVFSIQDRHDFHDAITWAGTQDWSNGRVGLTGVSYLAIAQWTAAANAPEHLKAITPWEGQTDNFREVLFHGGIPETAFTAFWSDRVRRKANESSLPPDFIMRFAGARPMLMKRVMDDFQPPSGIVLEEITVPALICASWSDHGMHTRGSFEGFKRISSEQKWLFTHGRSKWPTYYSEEALEAQTAFFDHFLKQEDNGFDQRPQVRLEVRDNLSEYSVRYEDRWPLASALYSKLFLDGDQSLLTEQMPGGAASVSYDAKVGQVTFRKTFLEETELTGNMKLKLWVQAEGSDDMDLFIALKKYDAQGNEITFFGKAGYTRAPVALGWLRVSQRELDQQRSTPAQPVLAHQRSLPLSQNEIVPVEIEILPSSTRFLPGEVLAVAIQGSDHFKHEALAHENTVNRGSHIIHAGGEYDSHLLVPKIGASLNRVSRSAESTHEL